MGITSNFLVYKSNLGLMKFWTWRMMEILMSEELWITFCFCSSPPFLPFFGCIYRLLTLKAYYTFSCFLVPISKLHRSLHVLEFMHCLRLQRFINMQWWAWSFECFLTLCSMLILSTTLYCIHFKHALALSCFGVELHISSFNTILQRWIPQSHNIHESKHCKHVNALQENYKISVFLMHFLIIFHHL